MLRADLAADALRVADELGQPAAATPPAAPEHGELLAMRAVLLAVEANASGAAAGAGLRGGALSEAAAGLPAGHMFRSPVLRALGEALGRAGNEAASSDDIGGAARGARRTSWTACRTMILRSPRTMTTVGIHMLSASSADRSVFQQDWVVTRFERLTSGLEPDDPLQPLAQFMLCRSGSRTRCSSTGRKPPTRSSKS